MSETMPIEGLDFWVKVVDMLQQNWAIIQYDPSDGARVFFISDRSEIFDQLTFRDVTEAEIALARNGFREFANAADLKSFLRAPLPPYREGRHPNGPIYSSGRFWQ